MEKNRKTQKVLFDSIVNMNFDIRRLAAFVQNDFSTMLADETLTKEDINSVIVDVDSEFDMVISKLNLYRKMLKDILLHYSE